jgi:uncharacterized protein (TIGR02186 family)
MIRLVLLLALMPAAAAAQEAPLVADVSEHLVAITSDFTGKDILLFGAIDGPGDIVVVVKGPPHQITVRKKNRVGPIWVNTQSSTFRDVPSFYRVASTRPAEEFVSDVLAARFQVGMANLRIEPEDQSADPAALDDFRKALVRLNSGNGLYDQEFSSVNMMSDRLFRTNLHFPANVPTGTYIVEVYLFREGTVASAVIVPFVISKIGIGADITEFAKNLGWLYGLISIALAVGAGWSASAAFRRA